MNTIQWGPEPLDRSQGTEHFLLVGASGSGKTTLLKILMKSVFDTEREFTGLIYDPKQELLPLLFSLQGDTPHQVQKGTSSVRVLNPFDARCCAWDLAKDIDGPVSARQLASILVPDGMGDSGAQFFTSAVRDLLTGVMLVFINCAKDDCQWTLRDLLLGTLYLPYLRVLLQQTTTRDGRQFPIVHRLRTTYIDAKDDRTVSNILATISAKLSVYEPVAAAWYQAQKKGKNFKFSLQDWAHGEFSDILVLGNDEAGRAAIDPINQAIFKRATELLLARPETSTQQKELGDKQTWIILDEVREAGMLDGLGRLLTKGRSKGACVVLSFQDIEGMRWVYGMEVANEICGQCNNTIVLRLNSPSTAQWASELFGKRLDIAETASTQAAGLTVGSGFQEEERPFLFTSDFSYMPSAGRKNGVNGFLRDPENSPDQRDPRWHLDFVADRALLPEEPQHAIPPFVPIDQGDFYLEPWSQEDWDRLGFKWPFNSIATNPEEALALGLPPRLDPGNASQEESPGKIRLPQDKP